MDAGKRRTFNFIAIVMFSLIVLQGFVFSVAGAIASYERKLSFDTTSKTNAQQALAAGLDIANEIATLSGGEEESVTIYNFVVPINFSNETLTLNNTWKYGKTFYQAFDEMYNTGEYSVNEYYRLASNGQVDVRSVLISDTNPVKSAKQRGYFSSYSATNSIGYQTDIEKGIRLFELTGSVFTTLANYIGTSPYKDSADSNNDGKVDSVSIIVLPEDNNGTKFIPDRNDLLWPHQFENSISGGSFQNSSGQTIKPSKYMIDNMSLGMVHEDVKLPNNSTAIHELGHLLFTLPDLYNYDQAESDYVGIQDEPVTYWDLMAGSTGNRPTQLLSYMREKSSFYKNGVKKEGFIASGQVQEITSNGTYTLQPTNYEEINNQNVSQERVVAYKIVNPVKPTQAIYMEYRYHDSNSFDNSAYLENGLLVYRVDEGFTSSMVGFSIPGNFYGPPYNVHVFRAQNLTQPSSTALPMQSAPINSLNTSMGKGAEYSIYYGVNPTQFRSSNITWQNYSLSQGSAQKQIKDVTYEDSGIVIEFAGLNPANMSISFSVEWEGFVADANDVNRMHFKNDELYDVLLTVAGKDSSDILRKDDFVDLSYINLSNFGLQDISGLEVFNFKQDVIIDLSNNKLNSLGSFFNFYAGTPQNISLNLILNEFYNTDMVDLIKNNGKEAVFGLQKLQKEFFVLPSLNNLLSGENNLTFYFYHDSSPFYTLQGGLPNNLQNGLNTFNIVGDYTFEFIAKSIIASGTKNLRAKVVSLDLKYETTSSLEVLSVFDIKNFLNISDNLYWQDISYVLQDQTGGAITQEQITQTIGLKNIFFLSESLGVKLNIRIRVVDTQSPEINLLSSNKIFVLKGQTLALPQVEVIDNYDTAPTLKFSQSIDINTVGEHQLEVYAQDSSGNRSNTISITVVIFDIVVQQEVEVEVFSVPDYMSMYNVYPQQHSGQFTAQLLAAANTNTLGSKQFTMLFKNTDFEDNNFEINGSVLVVDKTLPVVTISGDNTIFVFKGQVAVLPQINVTDNFDTNLNHILDKPLDSTSVGAFQVGVYAQDSSGNKAQKVFVTCVVVDVLVKSSNDVNVYDEINYQGLYSLTPNQYADLFSFNIVNDVNTNYLGKQNLSFTLEHKTQNNVKTVITISIIVKDLQAPTLMLADESKAEVFLYVGSAFNEFVVSDFVMSDNYSSTNAVRATFEKRGVVNTQRIGVYYLDFSVKDESGNTSKALSVKVSVLPEPIENLAVLQVSKIKVITPNTLLRFKVDTSQIIFEGRVELIKYVWFVDGIKVYEGTNEFFEHKFNKVGDFKVEVKAENTLSTGQKLLSTNSQAFTVTVTEGGVLDKYTLMIVAVISGGIIFAIVISLILQKARKRQYGM